MITNVVVVGELRRIAREHRGILRPEDVVEQATPEDSPLHNKFTWDNAKAGHAFRLWEARQLIKTVVELAPVGSDQRPVSVFTSISLKRGQTGYRETSVVLANDTMRAQLLQHAFDDLVRLEERYQHLRELATIFAKSREVRERYNRRQAA